MSGTPLTRYLTACRSAASLASDSLSKWLGRPSAISIEQVEAMPLEKAIGLLGDHEGTVCGCGMAISGSLQGILVLLCDDQAGLALAAMLLGREPSDDDTWGDLEQSAVVETTNIIGCAYLNAMADSTGADTAAMPSPPWFLRDFAPAVMQSIVMAQPLTGETVFLTRTEFTIEGSPARVSLVFVPAEDASEHLPGAPA
jgi:chemotaxis protein CheC